MLARAVFHSITIGCLAAAVARSVPDRALDSGPHPLCQGFLPKNSLYIAEAADPSRATGISHAEFDEILNRIRDEYSAEIAHRGGRFRIERDWSNGEVNAYADRDGRNWIIRMFGGMARYPSMTYDGYMAVACHETGHQVGGVPKFSGGDWASVEGEADYYASLKCLKRIFARDDNAKILALRRVDPLAIRQCEREHGGRQDQLLCIRATMAGFDLADVLATLDKAALPKLSTPDPRRVTETFEDHPRAQCRLDTYFQGSLCRVPYAQPVGDTDYHEGACADARAFLQGLRPRCWFAP